MSDRPGLSGGKCDSLGGKRDGNLHTEGGSGSQLGAFYVIMTITILTIAMILTIEYFSTQFGMRLSHVELLIYYYLSRTIGLLLSVCTCAIRLLEHWRSVGFVLYFLSVRTIGNITNECVLEHDGFKKTCGT